MIGYLIMLIILGTTDATHLLILMNQREGVWILLILELLFAER
jgi:hypothetical protein